MTASSYDWWMTALETVGDYGKLTREQLTRLGLHEDEPQCGFYRVPPSRRRIDGGMDAFVAIWPAAGTIHAIWDGEPIDPCAAWVWCAPYPIDEDTYRQREAKGFTPSYQMFEATVT